MARRVQSPALETIMDEPFEELEEGMQAKECHSLSGASAMRYVTQDLTFSGRCRRMACTPTPSLSG